MATVFEKIFKKKKFKNNDAYLPREFRELQFANQGLYKLITDYAFTSVLDVGSGAGNHAKILSAKGKSVTALDFGTSIYFNETEKNGYRQVIGDFMEIDFEEEFDCIWASHVLEHQPDSGAFIRRCMTLVKENGVLAISVPPLKHSIVGGHLTLWNAGLLLYQLAFNGLNCKEASVLTYGYNITVITKKVLRPHVKLDYDSGDINRLKDFLPDFCHEGFDGRIEKWNW